MIEFRHYKQQGFNGYRGVIFMIRHSGVIVSYYLFNIWLLLFECTKLPAIIKMTQWGKVSLLIASCFWSVVDKLEEISFYLMCHLKWYIIVVLFIVYMVRGTMLLSTRLIGRPSEVLAEGRDSFIRYWVLTRSVSKVRCFFSDYLFIVRNSQLFNIKTKEVSRYIQRR